MSRVKAPKQSTDKGELLIRIWSVPAMVPSIRRITPDCCGKSLADREKAVEPFAERLYGPGGVGCSKDHFINSRA